MAEKVFLNDRLVDSNEACISIKDSGFLYGMGLFETMRSYNGVVFAINDHLDRLFSSAKSLSINVGTYDKKILFEAIHQTLAANGLKDARLRLTLTNGQIDTDREPTPTVVVSATQFEGYPSKYYEKGARVILSQFRQNPADPTYGHKTLNYMPRILALNTAREKHAAEALWFTVDNRLAEGCVSNIFLVKDSQLFTPPLETPVLAGVARKTVCQIAGQAALDMYEKNLFISDLLEADEVFLTNVIMEVLPVIQIEAHTIGDGKVGRVSARLKRLFVETVTKQCRL
ncbi:MAG: aminotransferase class IV [Planctomycetota bacterium]